MDSDARYERPCRWMLAIAAGIQWTAVALAIGPTHEVNPAVQLAAALGRLLNVLLPG